MNGKDLINISIGETGMIAGKLYEAKGPEYFGAKGCMCCDLHEPGYGCTNKKVICYAPVRVYKEVKELKRGHEEGDVYDDYDDCNQFEDMKIWEIILLVAILAIPMSFWWIWGKILEIGIYIINKLRKWQNK